MMVCIYVRPHLEYAVQAWNPWTEADKAVLEKVQEQALRYVSGTRGKAYGDKLLATGLTTLEARRCRGDMIQVYKYLHNKQAVNPRKLFSLKQDTAVRTTRLSARPYALNEIDCRTDPRRHSFTARVVRQWNELPDELHHATSVDAFKNCYDKLFNSDA